MELESKSILITGGTGTFGKRLVQTILNQCAPKRLIVLSRDELKQSEMAEVWSPTKHPCLRYFLGDVRDKERLSRAFQGVDIVVHAAALKQVPALEYNPLEAIKTNIYGTQNVIDAAIDNNVDRVLLISTDKAVQPVNLYGATKLCAERLCVAANVYSGDRRTKFSVVRYGNVIRSRGSLLEIIERQRLTGRLKLTDERMTRFLIPLERVMDAVFFALQHMQGGEIFVPKMNSFKIAEVMKMLAPECNTEIVGIRPGEKIHEVLITEYESLKTKDLGPVFVILPAHDKNAEYEWFADKPAFPENSVYASDHPHYLIPAQQAAEILNGTNSSAL